MVDKDGSREALAVESILLTLINDEEIEEEEFNALSEILLESAINTTNQDHAYFIALARYQRFLPIGVLLEDEFLKLCNKGLQPQDPNHPSPQTMVIESQILEKDPTAKAKLKKILQSEESDFTKLHAITSYSLNHDLSEEDMKKLMAIYENTGNPQAKKDFAVNFNSFNPHSAPET